MGLGLGLSCSVKDAVKKGGLLRGTVGSLSVVLYKLK